MPSSEVAIGRRMKGSETPMGSACRIRRLLSGSWLLGSASRRPRPRARPGLPLLVALAALLLGAKLAVLLPFLGAILLLGIRPTRALARGEIGRRGLVVAAD